MPRKTRASWGSNEPARRKGYRRLRYWADLGDGRGYCRHSKTVKGSKRDGDAELARLRTKYEPDLDTRKPPAPRPTFRECWEKWYWPEVEERQSSGELARQTVGTYLNLWKSHIEPKWAEVHIADVDPSEYQTWLLGLTRSNARQCDIVVGNMAKCMKMRGSVVTFKDMSYRMPKNTTKREDSVWTHDEMEQIAMAARGTVCEVPCILMAFGSCRVGEACAPLLSDMTMAKCRGRRFALVNISKQVAQKGSIIEGLKTNQSVRTVVVPEPWCNRLSDIAEEKIAANLTYLNDDGTGQPVPRHRIALKWSALYRDKAITVRKLPMSKLRNSWETYTHWVLGIDKDKVDKMMGHTSSDVRSKHYDRPDAILFMEVIAEGMERIDKVP